MNKSNSRPTYAYIDMQAFSHNIDKARELSKTDIIAVVKADAYGHGAKAMAEYAYKYKNVRFFAVATFEEGAELRSVLPLDADIMILGYVAPCFLKDAHELGLIISIYSDESLAELLNTAKSIGKKIKTAVKLDTGMSRLGFSHFPNLVDILNHYVYIDIVHIYTHLASVFSDNNFADEQIMLFNKFLENSSNVKVTSSILSTAGIQYAQAQWTHARPGVMLYGYAATGEKSAFRPVMTVKSAVVHVNHLKKGCSVGYGRTFFADKDMYVGIVPMGYADGYRRDCSGKGYMLVNGVKCRVIGTVCMDMTMIDVTALGENALGAEVEILGNNIDADEIASWSGTISYEILCGISKRVNRVYINGE